MRSLTWAERQRDEVGLVAAVGGGIDRGERQPVHSRPHGREVVGDPREVPHSIVQTAHHTVAVPLFVADDRVRDRRRFLVEDGHAVERQTEVGDVEAIE